MSYGDMVYKYVLYETCAIVNSPCWIRILNFSLFVMHVNKATSFRYLRLMHLSICLNVGPRTYVEVTVTRHKEVPDKWLLGNKVQITLTPTVLSHQCMMLGHSFTCPANWSVIFQVRHFPVLHFRVLHFQCHILYSILSYTLCKGPAGPKPDAKKKHEVFCAVSEIEIDFIKTA